MALLILTLVPLAAALASLAVRSRVRWFEAFAVIAAVIELVAVFSIVTAVVRDGLYVFGILAVDALGAVILLALALVGAAASCYSIGYLRAEVAKGVIGFRRVKQYAVLLHCFLLAMFVAATASSPILMWIAIEATTLSTAFLISFYSKPSAMEAAWKYLTLNSIGLLLGFFGTLLLFTSVPDAGGDRLIDWSELLAAAGHANPLTAKIAFIFAIVGYGTKVGLVPMHTWLPDAHSKAPSPISALLSGALLNVAFLAILRFRTVVDATVGPAFTAQLLLAFGVLSIVVAACIMFVQRNYKRLFAYSSIEHMGIIALGFGFGGIGSFAALLHLIYHALGKSILFFTAGNIFLRYSSTKIANVRGVLTTMPATGIILFLGFLAIAGIPPFGTFLTEVFILSAGTATHPVLVAVVLAFLALAFVGFLKHVVAMTFGEPPEAAAHGASNAWTIAPPVILLALLIAVSVMLPEPLTALIADAVNSVAAH